MERNVYLDLTPPVKAFEKWLQVIEKECKAPESEKVDLWLSEARVTAEAILARQSSPAYHGAAMDGYALRAEDTFHATLRNPFKGEIGKNVWSVNTGQPLPSGCNAVVMIENVNFDESSKFIILEKAAFPWQNVRKTGEDIVETEVILPMGTLIGAQELGALAAGGVLEVPVFKKAKIAIIPSGSDLASIKEIDPAELRAGKKLPEFNSLVFGAMLRAAGAIADIRQIVPDDPVKILEEMKRAASDGADLIIINAGTSAGTHDFSAGVIAGCGRVLVHGVALMPGKPLVLGIAQLEGRSLPVAGIPGYPVSAWVDMEEFILPLLAFWQKRPFPKRASMLARPINNLPSRPGMEERLRVRLGMVDDTVWAVPLPRGAGTVTSLSRADAILSVSAQSEGVNAGEEAELALLRPGEIIKDSLLVIGSHDNALDLIDSLLRRKYPSFSLTSAHAGSLGGLLALAKGQAHLAGSHLLDLKTGEYNKTAIREHLKNVSVTLVRLAGREQGLMTAPGNPLNIKGIQDLIRTELRFINRQKGSGTRLLLDRELQRNNIRRDMVQGYQDEEYTHMNVAQAVLSGQANLGLGVRAAANALGLDFIPVGNEEYDLVIPTRFMKDARILALLEIIRSEEFRELVNSLGGYDTGKTGEIVWEYDGK